MPTSSIPVSWNCRAPGRVLRSDRREVDATRQPQIQNRNQTVLPRSLRLTRTGEYRAVYAGGRSRRGQSLVCIVLARPGEATRAGVVASKRVGGAVERNRSKRRLRHALRRLWPSLPESGFHIVLVATPGTGKVDYPQLLSELERSLSELGVTRASTPSTSKPDPPRDSGKAS